MASTGFGEGALDGTVHIRTANALEGDGLVSCIHHRQVLDVLESLDGDTSLNPAGSPVGEVVPAVGILVDDVGGIGKVFFHDFPGPRPRKVREVTFLLRVLIAVDCVQRCKDTRFLHRQNGFEG